ncbi:MAG: hypothetical protein U0441_24920 [Polyangiaceae bacterium]
MLLFVVLPARRMGPLFSDEHLVEIGRLLPELKRQALARQPDNPAVLQTDRLAVAYTVTPSDDQWVHHLSVSTPVTQARAAGTFFLGLVRGALHLEASPVDVFVTQNHVFHFIVALTDEQQASFVAAPVEHADARELRELAVRWQHALRPLLREQTVPELSHLPPAASGEA